MAVGRGADLVRDIDPTLGREFGSSGRVDTSHGTSNGFKAIASLLAVWSGIGGIVEGPNPTATIWWQNSTVLQVVQAWLQVANHLIAGYSSVANGCSHHHADK